MPEFKITKSKFLSNTKKKNKKSCSKETIKKGVQLCQARPLGGNQVLVVLVLPDQVDLGCHEGVVPVHDVPDLVEPLASVHHPRHVRLERLSEINI